MAILSNERSASLDEIVAEMDRRGRVIEELEAKIEAISSTPAPSQDAAVVERARNELVIDAYRAMDAIDAIRRWCDGQAYENDTITVAKLRGFLPSLAATRPAEAQAVAEVERLREAFRIATDALDGLSYIHDGNPSDVMADMPPADYARHMLFEARQIARGAATDARCALAASPATGGA